MQMQNKQRLYVCLIMAYPFMQIGIIMIKKCFILKSFKINKSFFDIAHTTAYIDFFPSLLTLHLFHDLENCKVYIFMSGD